MGSGLHFQVGFAGNREEDGRKDAAISSEMLLAWTRSPATEVGPRVRWWRCESDGGDGLAVGSRGSPRLLSLWVSEGQCWKSTTRWTYKV